MHFHTDQKDKSPERYEVTMAKRVPTQIVIAAFHSEESATAAAELLLDATEGEEGLVCTNVAIITQDANAKIKVRELGKVTKLQGAASGGVSGGLIGGLVGGACCLLLGPAGIAAGAAYGAAAGAGTGAVVGGVGASMVESMDEDKLNKLGSVLGPGNSAIVIVLDEVVVSKAEWDSMTEVRETRDAIFKQMAYKIDETLKSNEDIAYHFAVAEDGMAATRVIVGAEAANVTSFLLTPEGAMAGQATGTAEGVSVEAVAATAEGIVRGRAAITDDAIVYEAVAADEVDAVRKAGFIVPTEDGGVAIVEAST